MAKTSYVLHALKILGLEEILKLSEILHVKQVPLKKAAGAELIVWDDAPEKPHRKNDHEDQAKVLFFPKKIEEELEAQKELVDSNEDSHLNSEVALLQRELGKISDDSLHKMEAFRGYKKSTEVYVVKTQTTDGKEKVRFAETNGILINKKQA